MVIEELIEKKEDYVFPQLRYERPSGYHYDTENTRVFHSRYEYWYDGRKFLIGCFCQSEIVMIEVETFSLAVSQRDFPNGTKDIGMIIAKFKDKLLRAGKSIHEVVRVFKSNNLDLELWLVNSLVI